MIVGEYTQTEQLPPAVLADLRTHPAYRTALQEGADCDFGYQCYEFAGFNLLNLKRTLAELERRVEGVPVDLRRVEDFVGRASSRSSHRLGHWVLLNLDTNEYVRREYLAQKNAPAVQEREGGFMCRGRYGLGNALTYAITFGMDVEPERPWAGHRFMLTSVRYLQTRIDKGEVWKDASETIFRGMEEFYGGI